MNYAEMEKIRQQRGLPESTPDRLLYPLSTYTVFCQEAGGGGTIHIASVEAIDLSSAIAAGVQQCINDWSAGDDSEEIQWTRDTVHCLGVAEGNVKILHWEDQAE